MGGVGETLVSAAVEKVCDKLIDLLAEQLHLLWNFKDDMEYMKSTMLKIKAVLSDADTTTERTFTNTHLLTVFRENC
jgi:Rx N-terminal domain